MSLIEQAITKTSNEQNKVTETKFANKTTHPVNSKHTSSVLSRSLRYKCEINEELKSLPISLSDLEEKKIAPSKDKHQLQINQYKALRIPILKVASEGNAKAAISSHNENPNIVAITSALPGEGKTQTAINLAIQLSKQKENSVLLIDADFQRKTLSKAFEVEEKHGFSEFIDSNSLKLHDVIYQTKIPDLMIMPVGAGRDDVTEVLTSNETKILLNTLSKADSNRIIIIDTPPLLLTVESSLIAGNVGQVLVVVAESETSKQEVKDALSLLDANKTIGLILNKSRPSIKRKYAEYY